jgi:hypothetical protein
MKEVPYEVSARKDRNSLRYVGYLHVLFKFWRRRLELFLDLIRPSGSETMLDVGGYPGSW